MIVKQPEAVIAVFERQPYWGPELQRQFANSTVSIRECRAVCDLVPAISGYLSAVGVIDLAADLTGCLDWLRDSKPNLPDRCSIIACGGPDDAELEWVLREAGVAVFLADVIPGDHFARLCRKQLGLLVNVR